MARKAKKPPAPADTGAWLAPALVCACLVGLAVVLYLKTLGHGFVYFDDNVFVFENPAVCRGLCWANVKWAFSNLGQYAYWQPLTWLSLMLDSTLHSIDPMGFHLTNLVLHALNTGLLFLFFFRATRRLWPSAFIAALFAAHPMHVESVAWITERKDVLSALFWMLGLHAYLGYARRPGPAAYGLVVAAIILGLMAKPMLATLPCIFLLLDYWPLARFRFAGPTRGPGASPLAAPTSRLILEKLPLLALSAASIIMTIISHPGSGITGSAPLSLRLANALVSYPIYMGKLVWPSNLAAHHPFPDSIAAWEAAAALALMVAATALAAWLGRRRGWALTGWLWFVIALTPTLKLNQFGLWYSTADRFAYLPYIGLYLVAAFAGADILGPRLSRRVLAAAAVGAILALGLRAFIQLDSWRDTEALYARILEIHPKDAFALNNYGNALRAQGRTGEAAKMFEAAARNRPGYALALYNLGLTLQDLGRTYEAEAAYDQALNVQPNNADIH
ncbi:MAG: tetratricopeptide repeat protein, partial [Desulfovibrionaceae bacterium]|nr:tetratricopeptide repeat protein [Desulfovibrionaceae bacterium]